MFLLNVTGNQANSLPSPLYSQSQRPLGVLRRWAVGGILLLDLPGAPLQASVYLLCLSECPCLWLACVPGGTRVLCFSLAICSGLLCCPDSWDTFDR